MCVTPCLVSTSLGFRLWVLFAAADNSMRMANLNVRLQVPLGFAIAPLPPACACRPYASKWTTSWLSPWDARSRALAPSHSTCFAVAMAHFELSPAILSETLTALRRHGCAGWPWASSCCASSCTSMSAMAPASRTSRCRLRFQGRPQSSRLLLSAPAVVTCCLSCPVLDPPVGNWTSLPGCCKARQHKPLTAAAAPLI